MMGGNILRRLLVLRRVWSAYAAYWKKMNWAAQATPDLKIAVIPTEGCPSEIVHAARGRYYVIRFTVELYQQRKRLIGRQNSVEVLWDGKLGKRLEKAAKLKATHALIMGAERNETR
jgi:hypothetical protein